MVPDVLVALPSTVLFPRERRNDGPPRFWLRSPKVPLSVIVELETLTVATPVEPALTLTPSAPANATQPSIFSSAAADVPIKHSNAVPLSEARQLRSVTFDPGPVSAPVEHAASPTCSTMARASPLSPTL